MQRKAVIQCVFTNPGVNPNNVVGNYQKAANYWINARNRVNNFVINYQASLLFTNRHMERNMLDKSIKASTTIAGESFETKHWKRINGMPVVYHGPGQREGIDIKVFNNEMGGRNFRGQAHTEVKSSSDVNWRQLFRNVAAPNRVAYLEGAALANAQANLNAFGQYTVYDKNRIRRRPFRCI